MESRALETIDMKHNNLRFKCTISTSNTKVRVCITCLADYCVKDDTCLIAMEMHKTSSSRSPITLTDVYHKLIKGQTGASQFSPKLKGSIYAVLCVLLYRAQQSGVITMEDTVMIEKDWRTIPRQETSDVIHFYESLGFSYDSTMDTLSASAYDLLYKCYMNKAKISQELQTVMQREAVEVEALLQRLIQ